MIIPRTLQRLRTRFPIVTAMLLVSCLVTTVPQAFLGSLYSDDMRENSETLTDYSVTSFGESIEWSALWAGPRKMRVVLSRPLTEKDKFYLRYAVMDSGGKRRQVVLEDGSFPVR